MSGILPPRPPVMPPGGPVGLRQGINPMAPQGPPQQGLLAPNTQSYGAPPLPPIEGLVRPMGQRPTDHQVIATLLPRRKDEDIPDDPTDDLPPEIRPYALGLRPSVQPSSTPWVQEIVYQRLGKEDHEIAEINRYYFGIARNYDEELSGQRVTASEYYNGKGFGDEPALKGRSQLVMTVVRDTIRSTLPSLLRVFTGVEGEVPWPRAPEHADHVGHGVDWIDGVFHADPRAIPGAKGRSLRWLSSPEFVAALHELRRVTEVSSPTSPAD